MQAITIRNMPPQIGQAIRKRAGEKGVSLNKAVISLLEEGLGLGKRKRETIHHDLDHLSGTWSEEEAAIFERSLARARAIDKEVWA